MKPLKLTGNFDRIERIADACNEMEHAKAVVDTIVANGEHGSEEYHEALKTFKSAQAEYDSLLKELK